jgi:hypothetical protein
LRGEVNVFFAEGKDYQEGCTHIAGLFCSVTIQQAGCSCRILSIMGCGVSDKMCFNGT